MKMRHIAAIVLGVWLVSLGFAALTGQLQNRGFFFAALSFCIGAFTMRRIGFTEVPPNVHLGIILGLPLLLCIYAISGDLLHVGSSVSWAIIALSYIAGSRAANLRQMLQQGA